MTIYHKDFIQKPNYKYEPWDEKLQDNPIVKLQ